MALYDSDKHEHHSYICDHVVGVAGGVGVLSVVFSFISYLFLVNVVGMADGSCLVFCWGTAEVAVFVAVQLCVSWPLDRIDISHTFIITKLNFLYLYCLVHAG